MKRFAVLFSSFFLFVWESSAAPQPKAQRERDQHHKKVLSEEEEPSMEESHPWSLGFGLSGYSSSAGSTFVISLGARYTWEKWTETLSALDLFLGSQSHLGAMLGERFYAPLGRFRPYVQGGYRRFNVTDSASAAWEMGGGLQWWTGPRSFFEVGALYLLRTPFDRQALNFWMIAAASGFHF